MFLVLSSEVIGISRSFEVFSVLDEQLGDSVKIVLRRNALGKSVFLDFGCSLSMDRLEHVGSLVRDEGFEYSLFSENGVLLMKVERSV